MIKPVLMKLGEVKEHLGVSRDQISGMVRRQEIKAVKVGRQTMYDRRSVRRWMKANEMEMED